MDSDPPVLQELVPSESVPLAPEPVMASILRRVLGWLIDYGMVMVPAAILVTLALSSIVHALPGYVGGLAAEVGWSHLVGLIAHRGTEAGGLSKAASGEWVRVAAPLIGALLLVPLIQFLYQATLLAWRGRTIGKMVADTRVGMAVAHAPRLIRRVALRRALTTTVLETGLVSIALIVVTIGEISIGGLFWVVAVVAFWINVLAALGPRRRTIVDRLARTVVVRRALHAEVAERTVDLARRTSDVAVAAGRKSSDIAITTRRKTSETAVAAGRATSDAAVVAGQVAREGAEALMRSVPVQQVLNSRAGQQSQALGAAGADRARQVGEQAASRARKFGGRAQQMWQERQAQRRQQEERIPRLTEKPEYPAPE
jgi:uncharacterized RDD family membrane protein YckC